MTSIFEKLNHYFNNTCDEQFEKDWEATADFDKIKGPSVDEFIQNTCLLIEVDLSPPENYGGNFENINKNPNFTSDFFIQLN